MLVDWEAVVLDLRAYMQQKEGNSYGHRELADLLDELTVRHRQVEGLAVKALRLYGDELADVIAQPNGRGVEAPERMAEPITSS